MKVIKKQTNSKMCIICGIENDLGLKAPFYEMEDESVVSIFEYKDYHQSYPERCHGGMITCMLDEIIGRAIWIHEPEVWGVTTNISVKFRKPVPLNQKIKATGRITVNKSRIFQGIGTITTLDGAVLAEAEVTYLKLPLAKIASGNHEDVNILIPDNVTEIE